MSFIPEKSRRADIVIEITPLVDIVFQLLIFFLLTATFVVNPNMEINLPKASIEQLSTKQREFTIEINNEGRIKHERKDVNMDQLKRLLERHHAGNPDTMILIRADRESRHGRVVEVMDLAKQVGFSHLGIAVEVGKGAH